MGFVLWTERFPVYKRCFFRSKLKLLHYRNGSLYLIHWPVIVFGRRLFPTVDANIFAIAVFLISIRLAFLNYRFVKQYFRYPKKEQRPVKILVASAEILCLVIAISGFTIYKSGFPDGLDSRINKALSYLKFDYKELYRSGTCFLGPDQEPTEVNISSCLPNDNGTKVLIWGDSHAAHLYPGLMETLGARGYSVGMLTASACPPIIGIDINDRPKCRSFNDMVFATIQKVQPKILIMSASWNAPDENRLVALENTVHKLSEIGVQVVLLGQPPFYKKSVPIMIADRLKAGNSDMTAFDELEGFVNSSENYMSKLFSNRSDVKYVPVR